ncbi:hypothetical protein [Serratia fonticola]|uniref:hypothetical protein n=1 Tax=Serratia fonticola TaxID=47917 RepID=UPI000E0FE32A|nr:hypothetical protein [Serratia fonticola]RDL25079.1 hypothetical protein DFO62_10611 [Serratia fonticola]
MNVYWQSIVHDMGKLSDEKLKELSRDSENAHMALMKGICAIGSLMITAGDSDGFGDNEAKEHLAPIGDLLMQLSRYSEALFNNAGNAEHEMSRRNNGAEGGGR